MFDFADPEQKEIRNSVAKLAQREIPKYQTPEHCGTVPLELFRTLGDLGLAGLSISEEYGGIAANPLTFAIALEELAAVDLGVAIVISVHNMVAGIIQRNGSEQQKAQWLPRMASAELLGAFALTEPSAGSDAAALRSQAIPTNGGYTLRGEKCYITSAGFAGLYVTFARTSIENGRDGISSFILSSEDPGLLISPPEKKMGAELSPIASLTFENLFVDNSRLLGNEGSGYRTALSGLAGGRISIAACALGLNRSAIAIATAHLKERKQFGHALAEFQGLQFMLADMVMQAEAARLLTWHAAHCLHTNPKDRANRLNPSMAKCYATDAAMKITTDAVQLLGGAGYIKEYKVEQLMRDAKMLQIVEGANQVQRSLIAREHLAL